ncbi:MAG: hypothetical protein AB7H80_08270 [Candidatus Kapaibacterium sp.]
MIVAHPDAAFWDPSWLCSLLSGWWMEFAGFSILSLRIAVIFCYVGIALLLYGILKEFYERNHLLVAILLCFLLLMSGTNHLVPNYYFVPPLFALSATYFYVRSLRAKSHQFLLMFLSGFLFAFLPMSRLPSGLFALFYLVGGFMERRSGVEWGVVIQRQVSALAGIGAGVGIAIAYLHSVGQLDAMVSGILSMMSDTANNAGGENIHHPARLLVDSLIRYGKVLGVGVGIAVPAFFVARGLRGVSPQTRHLSYIAIALITVGATIYLNLRQMGMFPPPIGLALLLFIITVRRQKSEQSEESSHRNYLYVIAILFMIFMNIGSSNNMTFSLNFTILLLLPIGVAEGIALWKREEWVKILVIILFANIVSLFLVSRLYNRGFVFNQQGTFVAPALAGLCADTSLTRPYNELTEAMAEVGIVEGDTLLCYPDLPMLHFTSQTIPAFVNPWISDVYVGFPSDALIEKMLTVEGKYPPYVVRGYPDEVEGEEKSRFLDKFWSRYDTVARGDKFSILKRPD